MGCINHILSWLRTLHRCIYIVKPNGLSNHRKWWRGRYILANLQFTTEKLFVVNVYALTDCCLQIPFLQELTHLLVSKSCTLKGIKVGDWNTTLSHLVEIGGLPWRETTYRNGLVSLMKEFKKESTRGSSKERKKLCINIIYIVMRSRNC